MKIFFTLLFCIAATQVLSAEPATSGPASNTPASDTNTSKKEGSKPTDDQIKDAKGKAKDDVTAAFSKAEGVVKGDEKAKKRLEGFKAAVLKMIQGAGKPDDNAPAPPAGGKSPIPPTGGESPTPPTGGESPTPPTGAKSPPSSAGGENPTSPSGGETPAPPA